MSTVLERSLAILEYLVNEPEGATLGHIAGHLDLPPSAVHRLLRELMALGYVRQEDHHGTYRLSIKLASMGLNFLGQTGITDISQPILDHLAARSGELVRLSVFEDGKLTWIGVAQGAKAGLRFDPGSEQGVVAHLASSAGGQAVLSTFSDEEAIALVVEQGLELKLETAGPNAPKSLSQLLDILAAARQRGYARNKDSYFSGMAAMAAPIWDAPRTRVLGAVSIAGPTVRFTEKRMEALAPELLQAAEDLGQAAKASRYFMQATGRAEARSRQNDASPRKTRSA